MPDFLDCSPGARLTLDDYLTDYENRFAMSDGHDSWKLERKQHFKERNNVSWGAFVKGDWDESLRLIEAQRKDVEEDIRDAADRGIDLFRVRVVECPIVPYLQWELNSLRVSEECGEKIRTVGPEKIRELEEDGPLPELLTVGADTVYRLLYDENDLINGAIRFTDADVVTRCVKFIEQIYAVGEELGGFFQRKVAHLEPPHQR